MNVMLKKWLNGIDTEKELTVGVYWRFTNNRHGHKVLNSTFQETVHVFSAIHDNIQTQQIIKQSMYSQCAKMRIEPTGSSSRSVVLCRCGAVSAQVQNSLSTGAEHYQCRCKHKQSVKCIAWQAPQKNHPVSQITIRLTSQSLEWKSASNEPIFWSVAQFWWFLSWPTPLAVQVRLKNKWHSSKQKSCLQCRITFN